MLWLETQERMHHKEANDVLEAVKKRFVRFPDVGEERGDVYGVSTGTTNLDWCMGEYNS